MHKRLAALLAAGWLGVILVGTMVPIPFVKRMGGGFLLGHDALVHAALFAGYALSCLVATRGALGRRVGLTLLSGATLGGGIEVVQNLLPWERGMKLSDFLGDLAGLVAGVVLFLAVRRLFRLFRASEEADTLT